MKVVISQSICHIRSDPRAVVKVIAPELIAQNRDQLAVAQLQKLLLRCLSERYIIFSYRLIYNLIVNGDKSSSVGQIQQLIQAVFKTVGIILQWVIEAEI